MMNEQNQEYLKDNLKYLGFGESLYPDLEKSLQSGAPEFQLTHSSEIHKKPFEVTLHFRKAADSDRYFFNSYQATLKRSNGVIKGQVFYVSKGKGVTAKEAYNLLEGRAVFKEFSTKEGETYKAWIQLDFERRDRHNNHEVKQYHDNYGYDLKAAVANYPVTDLDGGEREKAMLYSLQKGNLQAVTMEKDGSVTKFFLQANPQFKSITIYDSDLKLVPRESLDRYLGKEAAKAKGLSENNSEKQGPAKTSKPETKAQSQGRSASSR